MGYLYINSHESLFHFNFKILMPWHLMALHAEAIGKYDVSRATFKIRFFRKENFDGLNQI